MMLKGEPILYLHVLIHDTSLELVDATTKYKHWGIKGFATVGTKNLS